MGVDLDDLFTARKQVFFFLVEGRWVWEKGVIFRVVVAMYVQYYP